MKRSLSSKTHIFMRRWFWSKYILVWVDVGSNIFWFVLMLVQIYFGLSWCWFKYILVWVDVGSNIFWLGLTNFSVLNNLNEANPIVRLFETSFDQSFIFCQSPGFCIANFKKYDFDILNFSDLFLRVPWKSNKNPDAVFKEFIPRRWTAQNRLQLSVGSDLKTLNTI